MNINRILVICVGNICRSPIAEALLSEKLSNIQVSSAGLATEMSGLTGAQADRLALETAKKNNLDISRHRARQLTRDMTALFDLILVMEPEHIEQVSKIAPESRHKVLLMGQWGEGTIPDPYKKSEDTFSRTFQKLLKASESWAKKL